MLTLEEKQDLSQLIHQSMKDLGTKKIAAELDMPYSTLMGQMNPAIEEHKLGVYTLLSILDILGAQAGQPILDWIAKRYGFLLTPLETLKSTSENLGRLMLQLDKESGKLSDTVLMVTAPESEGGSLITTNEQNQLYVQIRKVLEVLYQLYSTPNSSL